MHIENTTAEPTQAGLAYPAENAKAPPRPNGAMRAENILGLPISGSQWSCLITITPAMAATLLETMPRQRPIRRSIVMRYAAVMKAGRWRTTHQGLAFNTRGALIDGQHRLSACVESGVDLAIMATFACSATAFEFVDRPVIRTIADDLAVMGISSGPVAQVLQSAGRIIFMLDAGLPPQALHKHGAPIIYTVDSLADVMVRHPLLLATATLFHSSKVVPPRIPASPMVAFWTLFREVDDTLALMFGEQILTGAGLEAGDPASAIRASLIRTPNQKRAQSRFALMFRLVRGWNALRQGRKINHLVGASTEEGTFPAISGRKPA